MNVSSSKLRPHSVNLRIGCLFYNTLLALTNQLTNYHQFEGSAAGPPTDRLTNRPPDTHWQTFRKIGRWAMDVIESLSTIKCMEILWTRGHMMRSAKPHWKCTVPIAWIAKQRMESSSVLNTRRRPHKKLSFRWPFRKWHMYCCVLYWLVGPWMHHRAGWIMEIFRIAVQINI